MEVTGKINSLKSFVSGLFAKTKALFVKQTLGGQKPEINFQAVKILSGSSVVVFMVVVLILPDEVPVEFSQKIDSTAANESAESASSAGNVGAKDLWSPARMNIPSRAQGGEINHNTPMVLGFKNGNAKTLIRAGIRVPLRILDKVIVSQDSVPVLAESILDTTSDSGLRLPAGTRFYGEASFGRGEARAQIRFRQISLPTGQIKSLAGIALGKDGQPGVSGRIYSDGNKNVAGQVITTFVGGLAQGSMETDILGNSKGGIQNGLLSAVASTAKDRAQAYGEKLKKEREWIEIPPSQECDVLLSESLNLQEGGESL